ncbi:MAG: HRDC domain-containing protein [Deltaproteobacteria bacterium]|nr:HRDC domain-containing protein [Deltaproteobacteria bacterium]MCB9489498.1 HRDC domain-containing protein [Deltaproteobacteria bacterium]
MSGTGGPVRLKIFTLEFDDEKRNFDDRELQAFLKGRDLRRFSDHFFIHHGRPYLTVVASYLGEAPTARDASGSHGSTGGEKPTIPEATTATTRTRDLREELDARQRDIFDRLSAWRLRQAKRESSPAYVVATNRQLVEIIQRSPSRVGELHAVRGFGHARVERYGELLLLALREAEDAVTSENSHAREKINEIRSSVSGQTASRERTMDGKTTGEGIVTLPMRRHEGRSLGMSSDVPMPPPPSREKEEEDPF